MVLLKISSLILFAISNNQIGKYDRSTGAEIAAWTGDKVPFPHINSCGEQENLSGGGRLGYLPWRG